MKRETSQLIREGDYVAEVVIVIDDDAGDWSPTIGIDDVRKLDRVREALRSGHLDLAGKDATIFRLVPYKATPASALGFREDDQEGFKP